MVDFPKNFNLDGDNLEEILHQTVKAMRRGKEEIKQAYEQTHQLMLRLMAAREKEQGLRARRDEMEHTLKSLEHLVQKAEYFLSNVGVALEYLIGNLQDASKLLIDWKQRSEMAIRIIQAQEEERKRVAREIHDGPAQAVANVVLRAEICEKVLNQDIRVVQEELIGLKETARNSLTEIRRIIFDLRPMALDDLGLVPALRRYLGNLQERDFPVEMVVLGQEIRLDPTIELTLFRLAQEALNNAQKYAQARRVQLTLEFAPQAVILQVEDDGKGFSLDGVEHGGFGLLGMRERTELLDGQCQIDSEPGQGTKVIARIPVERIR